MRWMEERIGSERARDAYAFRKLKDGGAVLVFGSDSPGTNAARYFLSPVYGLFAAVTRQTLKGEPTGRLVPRPAPDDRGGDRGLHQGPGLGVLRGGPQGNARARQARRRRRLRHATSCRRAGRGPRTCSRRRCSTRSSAARSSTKPGLARVRPGDYDRRHAPHLLRRPRAGRPRGAARRQRHRSPRPGPRDQAVQREGPLRLGGRRPGEGRRQERARQLHRARTGCS